MATNLISEIADVLSPSIVSRVASALGLNQTSTQKSCRCGCTRSSRERANRRVAH